MNITAIKATVWSREAASRFVSAFLQAFGALAILLGVGDILFPNTLDLQYSGLWIVSLASCLWALGAIVPRLEISRRLLVPDTTIRIKVGDLFEQDGNLVIGMSDTFDTEKGTIIKSTSVQGCFLARVYGDDLRRLDEELEQALAGLPYRPDEGKVQGKNRRYEVGTVVTLCVGSRRFFCSAYSTMGNDLRAQSDVRTLTRSLDMLWQEIRLKGQRGKVAMAVLGSDLARIGAASHSNLIKLIVASFVLASREAPISEELTVMIFPTNLHKVNLFDLSDFLRNF